MNHRHPDEQSAPPSSPGAPLAPLAITGLLLAPVITGVLLVRLRRQVGMSQSEMARGLLVTRQTVCEWERGRRLIPIRQYTAIVDLLDVAAAALDALARRLLVHLPLIAPDLAQEPPVGRVDGEGENAPPSERPLRDAREAHQKAQADTDAHQAASDVRQRALAQQAKSVREAHEAEEAQETG